MDRDCTSELTERVAAAAASGEALEIRGAGTKRFMGRVPRGTPLELATHRGIIEYQPKELVVTARAGTRLADIESTLAEQGQCLPFEPPHFGADATIGGTIACGLSGPARPYAGSARDHVLGTRVLTGRAQVMRFGGEVMKNVAGYDLPRLMTGAFGTLGVLLDVSLKVMPLHAAERALVQERSAAEALRRMNEWARTPLPITATCYDGLRLYVRLAGAETAVASAAASIGGEALPDGADFWRTRIREQGHRFFEHKGNLMRLSVPPTSPFDESLGSQLIEWGGAQRWLYGTRSAVSLRRAVADLGGHLALFKADEDARRGDVFHPLSAPSMRLHQALKRAFDPQGVFNPGRLYEAI